MDSAVIVTCFILYCTVQERKGLNNICAHQDLQSVLEYIASHISVLFTFGESSFSPMSGPGR